MPTPTGPAALAARRSTRRRALSLAPWAVALLLAALGFTRFAGSTDPALADTGLGLSPTPSAAPTPDLGSTSAPSISSPDAAAAPPPAGPELPAELTASVLGAARVALGSDGLGSTPSDAGTGAQVPQRWALDLAVVGVIEPAPGRLVVIVHGTVITSAPGRGWSTPTPAAVAVAVSTDGPPTVGPTWPLTAPATAVAPWGAVGGSPVTDVLVHQEVLDALLDAGWAPDAVSSIHALQDGLLLAHLDGTAPDGTSGERAVWLMRTPEGVTVAGHTASHSPAPPLQPDRPPQPDESPTPHPTAHTTETA